MIFQLTKNGNFAKATVVQNGQKMAFWGDELQSSKNMRKSTQESNSISCRKETALKEINLILEKLQDLKKVAEIFSLP